MSTPFLIPALILLALVTVAVLILPLLRRAAPSAAGAAFNRAVYRDQLLEVERDLERGVLDHTQAASARLEIERRLLATKDRDAGTIGSARKRGTFAIVIGVLVAGWATGVYLLLGAPGVPDMPIAARIAAEAAQERAASSGTDHPDIAALASRLEERLKATGGNADGWLLLARTETGLRQWDKSAEAYSHVLALQPDATGSPVEVAYAEALTLAANGIVTPAAKTSLDHVLAKDPGNQIARFYAALAAEQAGELKPAIDQWLHLAGELTADSNMRIEIARRIDEAARQAGIASPPLPPPIKGQ